MNADETPVEEPESSSRAAGGCVAAVLGGGVLAVVFAISREAGVLSLWTVGGFGLWCAIRRVPHAANPAPPPPSEGVEEKKPQFRVIDDPHNAARHIVVWGAERETDS